MSAILVPLLGIVFTFTSIVVIVLIIMRYKARKLEHQEIMKALEQGRDLPTLEVKKEGRADSDLRIGIMSLAVGVGTYLFFNAGPTGMHEFAGLGFVPALFGGGMIALYFLAKNDEEKKG